MEFVDRYPSLCELAGPPLPAHLQSTSFVPLLQTPDQPWKTATFTQVVRGAQTARSMRSQEYRLTRWHLNGQPNKSLTFELDDLQNNAWERVNIVDKPENKALVKRLQAHLDAGWQSAAPKTQPMINPTTSIIEHTVTFSLRHPASSAEERDLTPLANI